MGALETGEALNVENITVESTNRGTNTSTDLSSSASVLSNEYEIDLVSAIVNNSDPLEMENTCNVCEQQYEGSTTCHKCLAFCHHAAPCSLIEDNALCDVFCHLC